MPKADKNSELQASEIDGASKGGKARAVSLSPQRRSEIAKIAAGQRWNPVIETSGVLRELKSGKITLPEIVLPCAVLTNKMRVLSERGFAEAIGSKRGGSHWQRLREMSEEEYLPVFLSAPNLRSRISPSLRMMLSQPVRYRTRHGGEGFGIPAIVIPEICEVFLNARRDKLLRPDQEKFAQKAEIMMSGLARVGIIALVDSATGYDKERDREELEKILNAYIAPELLPWQLRFPQEWYEQLFRLRGWQWNPMSVKRPTLIGKDTSEIIYKRLPPGVYETLKAMNPYTDGKRRKHPYSRLLTEDIGNVHLERLVAQTTVLMRISSTMESFRRKLNVAIPIPKPPNPQGRLFEYASKELEDNED